MLYLPIFIQTRKYPVLIKSDPTLNVKKDLPLVISRVTHETMMRAWSWYIYIYKLHSGKQTRQKTTKTVCFFLFFRLTIQNTIKKQPQKLGCRTVSGMKRGIFEGPLHHLISSSWRINGDGSYEIHQGHTNTLDIQTLVEEVFEPLNISWEGFLGVPNTYSPGIWRILDVKGSLVSPQKEDSWKSHFTTSKFEKASSVQAPSWGSMFSFWLQTMFSLHPECAVVHHSQIHTNTYCIHMHTAHTTQISFNYMLCICISISHKYIYMYLHIYRERLFCVNPYYWYQTASLVRILSFSSQTNRSWKWWSVGDNSFME